MADTADLASFRRCCSQFATGVCIATVTAPNGTPHGLTVNSFTSVSLNPPLVLLCIDHSANVIQWFREAGKFGISVLGESQRDISNRFAQRGQDRFEGVAWHAGASGVPLLDGALSSFECEVRQIVSAGDHDVFIAEATRLEFAGGRPLLYFSSGYQEMR